MAPSRVGQCTACMTVSGNPDENSLEIYREVKQEYLNACSTPVVLFVIDIQ